MGFAGRAVLVLACAFQTIPACNSSEFTVSSPDSGTAGAAGSFGGTAGSTGGTTTDGSSGSGAGLGGSSGTAGSAGTGGTKIDAGRDSGTGGSAGSPPDAGIHPPTTGLVAWFDAWTIAQSPGSKVANWVNLLGNGVDASQSSSAAQPTYTQVAGAPAVAFDGIDDELSLPTGFADFTNGLSAFVVLRPAKLVPCEQIVQFATGVEQNDISVQIDGTYAFEFEVDNGNLRSPDNRLATNTNAMVEVIQTASATPATVLRVNGKIEGTANNVPEPQNVSRDYNTIGTGQYVECRHFAGAVFEILFYARELSSAEITQVETYLQTKWNCCSTQL